MTRELVFTALEPVLKPRKNWGRRTGGIAESASRSEPSWLHPRLRPGSAGIPEQSVVLKSSWFSGGDYICPVQPHPVINDPARGGVLSCQVLLLLEPKVTADLYLCLF